MNIEHGFVDLNLVRMICLCKLGRKMVNNGANFPKVIMSWSTTRLDGGIVNESGQQLDCIAGTQFPSSNP